MAFVAMAGLVHAQTSTTNSPPAHTRASAPVQSQLADPGRMTATATAFIRTIDAGRTVELWDSASIVTRNSVARQAFADAVAKARTPLGAVVGRDWFAVSRRSGGQNGLPAGNYVSVEFVTVFAGNRLARELVSFRLDEDGVWRFTGYTLR